MKRQTLALLFFISGACPSFGQIDITKYSNEFLQLGVGARALGMSNTGVSIVNDVTAAYWNPAGLTQITHKYDVSVMHSEYFAGIAKYDYAGFATKLDTASVLAVSVLRYGVDNIPNTLQLIDPQTQTINYGNITQFSVSNYAFLLSYAKKIPKIKGLSVGGNFKVIYSNVGPFANAWGFGVDIGTQYTYKKWKLGAILKDATGTYNIWTYNPSTFSSAFYQTGNAIPENSTELTLPNLTMSVGRQAKLWKDISVLGVVDLFCTFDGERNTVISSRISSIDPRFGVEFDYKKLVFLRGGVGNLQYITNYDGTQYLSYQPNFGIGIKIKMIHIDYALTNIGNTSEVLYSNVFSLKFSFN